MLSNWSLWLFTGIVLFILGPFMTASAAEVNVNQTSTRAPVIRIGADHNYPPYEFLDEEGQPAGYNVEMTYAIAELMGFDVEIVMTDWQSALQGLYSGQFDALQGIAWSEERAQSILFSPPHSIVNQSIFARKDSPAITTIDQLAGKEVIVQRASIMHEYLLEHQIQAQIIPVATHAGALRLLASGKHDYALVANLPSLYLSKEMGLSNISPILSPVSGQRLGYGALPAKEELISRFSEGLAILKNTGRQQVIYDKWLGTLEQPNLIWKQIGQVAAAATAILLLVVGIIMVWNTLLRKEVEKRSNQLKAQQQQLIQADKMASLGVLVSGVAHEINNPTGLLMLNLPILKEAWRDALPYLEEASEQRPGMKLAGLRFDRIKEELPHVLTEMNQSTERIRNIVNDLKDFARLEPNEIQQDVDLNQIVQTAVRLVDKSIRNATDRFAMELDGRHPIIKGSSQRIEQVIINLIINACDALTHRQQRIRISTSLNLAEDKVCLFIEDQGQGIEEEHLTRLTDPFFTTKREKGGTGLGLSVSAGIIKAHGGSLAFHSAIEGGTTVTVTLPIIKQGYRQATRGET